MRVKQEKDSEDVVVLLVVVHSTSDCPPIASDRKHERNELRFATSRSVFFPVD